MVQFVFLSPPVNKDEVRRPPFMNPDEPKVLVPGRSSKLPGGGSLRYLDQLRSRLLTRIGDAIYFDPPASWFP